jgi:cyclophilin family peptidyl-prolyl cis-trans isomerase
MMSLLLTLNATIIAPSFILAQESSGQTLAELKQRLSSVNQSLDNVQSQLESGEGEADLLREKYTDLVEEANSTIDQIRKAAMEQIKANGSADKDASVTRTLMGILLNAANEGDDAKILKTGDFLIEQGISPLWFETAAKSQRIPIDAREIFDELLIRQREATADDLPRVKLTTTQGDIVIELFENEAPETVGNFISLVESDFYSNIFFHRVIEGFMAQTGCPLGTGTGGPEYKIECECYSPEARPHFTGSLSMAHAGKDTGGSQFFLTFERTDTLDGRHTVFGRVIDGLEVLENLKRTHVVINRREEEIPDIKKDQIVSAEVIRKRDHVYRPNKVGVDEPPLEEPGDADKSEPKETPGNEEADTDSEVPQATNESEETKVDETGSDQSSEEKTGNDSDDQSAGSDAASDDEGNE